MTGSEFDISSLPDIYARIESYNRRKKKEIDTIFLQAQVFANHIWNGWDGKNVPLLRPWDFYPELFLEERELFEKAKAAKELEEYKERKRMAIYAHNARIKGQEVIE